MESSEKYFTKGRQTISPLSCLTGTSIFMLQNGTPPHLRSSLPQYMLIPSFQLFKPKTWESCLTSISFIPYMYTIDKACQFTLQQNFQDLTNSDYVHFDHLGSSHHPLSPSLLSIAFDHSPVYSKYSN